MKNARFYLSLVRRLLWVALLLATLQIASAAAIVDETFDTLETRTGTYTNVTVTSKAKTYIFITHSTGMTTVKIADLLPEAQRKLGYAATGGAPTKSPADANDVTARQSSAEATSDSDASPSAHSPWQSGWPNNFQFNYLDRKPPPQVMIGVLVIFAVLYFFFCYCYHLICVKAMGESSPLVWLPGLQLIPLLNAAGMSGWWIFAFCVPVLDVVTAILWCFNIARARNKGILTALALIFPLTHPFAIMYLAFSSGPPPMPTEKYKSMALGAA